MSTLKKVSTNLFRDAVTGAYYLICRRNGKQIKESLGTNDRTVASMKLHERLGEFTSTKNSRLSTWADVERQYVEVDLASRNLKPASLADKIGNIANLHRDWPGLAESKMRDITESDCKRWLARRLKRPKHGAQRICNEIDVLKDILALAVNEGAISRNPAENMKRLAIPKTEVEVPEHSDFERVVQDLRLRRLDDSADIIEILAFSGCRLAEAREIKWEDIDFDRGRFMVLGGELRPKNLDRQSRPLFPKLRRVLEKIIARRKLKEPLKGRIFQQRQCRRALHSACVRVKCSPLTHHALRHVFVSSALEVPEVTFKMVAKWIGHKDGGILVAKRYGHLRDEAEQSAASKL